MDELRALLRRLWDDYAAICPQAAAIHALLEAEGEVIVNDHIALRTWDDPRVSAQVLARPFVRAGYREAGRYRFVEKRLRARHYEHADPSLPLVFISELALAEFSPDLAATVADLLEQVPAETLAAPDLPARRRPWAVSSVQVEALRRESEYAAWLAAFGWRANHFTISVQALRRYGALEPLLALLKARGFAISAAGGEIKGSPAQGLEQASTLASSVEVELSDGPRTLPGCYYEFARRYPGPDGRLFRGFIEGSADRIFESTDARPLSAG